MSAASKRTLRTFLIASIYALGFLGIVASGGGGGGSSSGGDNNVVSVSNTNISRYGSSDFDDPSSKYSTDSSFVWGTSTFQ